MLGGAGRGGPGGGLNDLIQEAVRMKNSANAKLRTDFDASPSYLQHTMFSRDDVTAARALPSARERLEAATAIKENGNALFRAGKHRDAEFEYEHALATFRFLHNAES